MTFICSSSKFHVGAFRRNRLENIWDKGRELPRETFSFPIGFWIRATAINAPIWTIAACTIKHDSWNRDATWHGSSEEVQRGSPSQIRIERRLPLSTAESFRLTAFSEMQINGRLNDRRKALKTNQVYRCDESCETRIPLRFCMLSSK